MKMTQPGVAYKAPLIVHRTLRLRLEGCKFKPSLKHTARPISEKEKNQKRLSTGVHTLNPSTECQDLYRLRAT